jgi:hypothetical protein
MIWPLKKMQGILKCIKILIHISSRQKTIKSFYIYNLFRNQLKNMIFLIFNVFNVYNNIISKENS